MRLILKTKDRLVNDYRIAYKPYLVTGWFSGEWLKKELGLPENFHLDAHFSYPKDGNFHFSYKSFREDCEEFISVYWDNVKIKTIINKKAHIEYKTREEFKDNILGHMVPLYRAEPLDKVTFFPFTSVNFNVFDGDFKNRITDKIIKEKHVTDDDLVIDISEYKNHSLSIWGALRRLDKDELNTINPMYFYKHQRISDALILELACRVTANEQI
jgi:hypothetical protein